MIYTSVKWRGWRRLLSFISMNGPHSLYIDIPTDNGVKCSYLHMCQQFAKEGRRCLHLRIMNSYRVFWQAIKICSAK